MKNKKASDFKLNEEDESPFGVIGELEEQKEEESSTQMIERVKLNKN